MRLMSKKLVLIFFALLSLVVIFFVFQNISQPQLVTWDEAGYLWHGYQIHQAIKKGNWLDFFKLSQNQFYYPFFQSWYLGFTALFLGYTIESARLMSLLLLLPTIILVWLLGQELVKKNSWVAFLGVGFILSSPLILFYFSTAMKESLGLVLTLVCLWFYFQARKRKHRWLFFLTGFWVLILTLTKYNYGLLVLLALLTESFIWLILEKKYRDKDYWLNLGGLFLPIVLGMSYWLFVPTNNFSWFWEIIQNKWQVNLYETTTLGHLLYYPFELAFSYSFSWLAFIILLIGFIWGLRSWRDFKVRTLILFFLINFFLAGKHMANNQARFIFTSVPAFFLVGSLGLSQLYPYARKFFSRSFYLGLFAPFLLMAVIILLKDLLILPQMIRPTGSHQIESAVFYEQDYQNLWRFDFNRNNWPKIPAKPDGERVENMFEFIFNNIDLSKGVSLIGQANEFSPDLFRFYLAKTREEGLRLRENGYQEYIVVLEVQPSGRFDTLDYRRANLWTADVAKKVLSEPSFTFFNTKTFEDLGIKITILAKP